MLGGAAQKVEVSQVCLGEGGGGQFLRAGCRRRVCAEGRRGGRDGSGLGGSVG